MMDYARTISSWHRVLARFRPPGAALHLKRCYEADSATSIDKHHDEIQKLPKRALR
ncbi:hypothetical protein PAXINDRAFT_168685 [Paxillus involutus ATCC 200175]|nr:hypothetical protein PAXINDRAFT_168685 [Paxillus involutus ATCC 200175]